MIKFSFSLSSMVCLLLVSFPSLASAQSTLTDAQIAKKFYPIECQIIKRRVDISSPDQERMLGHKYDKFSVSGQSGTVMFAEFTNVSNGMRTADLLASLHIEYKGNSAVSSEPSILMFIQNVILPRWSWQFSEDYPALDLSVVSSKIPIDYEVMIVTASPSPVLSESQVKKFVFSDVYSLGKDMNSKLDKLLKGDMSMGDHPMYRIDMRSMCDQVKGK